MAALRTSATDPEPNDSADRRRPALSAVLPTLLLVAASAALVAYVLIGELIEGPTLRVDGIADSLVIAAAAALATGAWAAYPRSVELERARPEARVTTEAPSDDAEQAAAPSMTRAGIKSTDSPARQSPPSGFAAVSSAVAALLLAVALILDSNPPGNLGALADDAEVGQAAAKASIQPGEASASTPSAGGPDETTQESPGEEPTEEPTSEPITESTAVYVTVHDLSSYPDDAPCRPEPHDYAVAVGGTWDAPILRFSAGGQPLPPGKDPKLRDGGCGKDLSVTWKWHTSPGDVDLRRQ